MTELRNYLKKSIPEFQQDTLYLDGFLDASGDFLTDIKEAIEHFDFSHDYKRGEFYNVENSLRDRGIRLPVGLPLATRRRMLRDLAEIIVKNGTEDGLVHTMRLIGFDADILDAWTPNNEALRRGFYELDYNSGYTQTLTPLIGAQTPSIGRYNPTIGSLYFRSDDPCVNETPKIGRKLPNVGNQVPYIGSMFYKECPEKERYDLNSLVYTRFLYGTEEVYEDGVYFNGWEYKDRFKLNLIEKLPILGETYDQIPDKSLFVSKTPYNIVRFTEDNFNISVASYVDPDTGIEYAYSIDEGYRLVVQLVDYFVRKVFRPTTVRTIIIVALQEFVEEVGIEETFEEEWIVDPDIHQENLPVEDILDMQGCVDVAPVIGTPLLIGEKSPFVSQFSIIEPPRIGVDPTITYWNIGSYYPYVGEMDIPVGNLGSQDPNSNTTNESVVKCEYYSPTPFSTSYPISINDSKWYVGSEIPLVGQQEPQIGDRGKSEYPPIPLWKKTALSFVNNTNTQLTVRGSVKDINGDHQFVDIASVEHGSSFSSILPPDYHFVSVVGDVYTNKNLNINLSYQ